MKIKTNLRAGKKSGTVANPTSKSANEVEVSKPESSVSVSTTRCAGL